MLSGGKDDLGPLAMLENSVKKLKSPTQTQKLSRAQIDSALASLSDWVFESCGSVSLSSLEHPTEAESFSNASRVTDHLTERLRRRKVAYEVRGFESCG